MFPFPPGIGKIDVGRRDGMRCNLICQELFCVATNDSCVRKFSFGQPFCRSASFGVIEFNTEPIGFWSIQAGIEQEFASTTSEIKFYGAVVAKDGFPIEQPFEFSKGGKIGAQINDWLRHGTHLIHHPIEGGHGEWGRRS